ncbi:hypothetical protein A2866_00125 [Candidatus Roizmanbacteria bacterium RIFCSPHIGHO2_01_FULL_39_8]|uniref:Uncharacterized protein n=2 Tax=Candidatus Roizmaniibacteriota TaxID=1752723 RepID=A0A1F7GKR3_9BACT|nr:MAG: hypothetical protein A2866_00125 [Candidatus Roizmanbacteria bacterium RIFCSPHIGHO2_01_FULL_39_8]OGK27093.1 MAG: hypothetical protein A3C28_03045 [Candidatus Roizmanbacteria bacterium RIFCSPHIGHO2_02_FULL_39_9]
MHIPTITKSQRLIISHLSSLRFLTIDHLQQLFNHKDPHRIQEWLINLEEKKFIAIIKDPKNKTTPYIICLDQKARHILKDNRDIDPRFLERLYKEKAASPDFIQRLLFVTSCYLYLLKHKDKTSELNFFTQQDLQGYDYFPDPLPDAYIDQQDGKQTTRYFLDFIESGTSPGKVRYRVREYLRYADSEGWQENTSNAPLPTILFIFTSERQKKHIYYYAKALLEKSLNSDVEIFLTTREQILNDQENVDIWQKVEVEGL